MENAQNYFGLPEEFSSREHSKVAIVPCPYETNVGQGKGRAEAPAAILAASKQVELFDDELWTQPHVIGIHTCAEVTMDPVVDTEEKPFQPLYEVVNKLIVENKFPIVLGGEHSVSLGAVRAFAERYPDLSILQIDAQGGLRSTYEGNPYSHASISFHVYKVLQNPIVTSVGVRNISHEEVMWLENEKPNVNIFWARKMNKWNFHEIVNTLSNNVYLSIDVDGFDSSIMPATGTPEPGGMSWQQVCELIKVLCVRKNVVGADITELAPIANLHAPNFLVAKLLYKIVGYKYALELGVTKKYL
ncbi:MAG TPA: agmatinase [Oculatellaceae cyanobacterium]